MENYSIVMPGNHRPNGGSSIDHIPGNNLQLSFVTTCTDLLGKIP